MSGHRPIPQVGATVRGRVVEFHKRGALLRLDSGHTGSLKDVRFSWLERKPRLEEHLAPGDEIEVVVLKIRQAKRTGTAYLSFTRLPLIPNPWETVSQTHPIGSRQRCRVVEVFHGGVIVGFDSGLSGFVHHSEISWSDRKPVIADLFSVGDEIDVVITEIIADQFRIRASYRETLENPWNSLPEHFDAGQRTSARVVSIVNFGTFARLSNGCVGLLHQSRYASDMSDVAPGDSIPVVIDSYDVAARRIALLGVAA